MLGNLLKHKVISSANEILVGIGTNCPQGGDAGHGGWTSFRLEDLGGTCWSVTVNGKTSEQPLSVELRLEGDTEAATFLDALRFAVRVLESQLFLNSADEGDCQ